MEQAPETLVCPYCGNVNQFSQESCIKCKRNLGPIKEVMGTDMSSMQQDLNQEVKAIEPPPLMPELPTRPQEVKNCKFIDMKAFLIRGMGGRDNEIAARLFKQLNSRNIQGLQLSIGSINIQIDQNKQDTREYYFAERDLGEGALAIMAIQISPVGTDLFIEWRNYTLPSLTPKQFSIGLFILGLCFYIIPGIYYLIWWNNHKNDPPTDRKSDLEGFQYQDNQAFQLSVRAALEEAIDLAGISKSFIQEVSKEGNKDQRVI